MLFLSLSLVLPILASANTHGVSHNPKRHSELAHKVVAREPEPVAFFNETGGLHKRGSCQNARATWYDVGLGACGKNNVPSDDIIALTVQMYGDGYPGPQCFKGVTIECNGKQHSATIMDECMGCPYCGIDMSTGLFQKFAGLGAGVLNCNWWFNDGSSDSNPAPPPAPKPKPTPKAKPPPPPPPPTTTHTTPKPTPTTSHEDPKPSHSSVKHSSSSHSSSASPVPTPAGPQNIKNMFDAMIGLGRLVVDYNM